MIRRYRNISSEDDEHFLNASCRSITACLRLDIHAKKKLWQINYNCVSVSTELPSMPMNGTTRMIDVMSEETSTTTERVGQLPMTPSVIEASSTEMMTVQTSEMNAALMTRRTEQPNASSNVVVD